MDLRRWALLTAVLLLSACGAPSADEDALQRAVAATSTALADRVPVASTAVPAAAPTRAATPLAPGAAATRAPLGPAPAASPAAAPAAGTPGARLTPDEAAYAESALGVILEFNRSAAHFGQLLQQARPEDTSWQRALAAELSLWANGADMARSVQAPPTMQAFHQRILASLDLFQQASAQLVSALQAGDQATMQQGLTTAQRAHEAMSAVGAELSRMLDRGGP